MIKGMYITVILLIGCYKDHHSFCVCAIGIAEVPLHTIKLAAKGEVLAEVNHERVEVFKESITRSKDIKRPVLPVLVEGDSNDWEKENAESFSYILLGGYSLCQALRDICTDEK